MRVVPDKSFMSIPKGQRYLDNQYEEGVLAFLNYANENPYRSRSGLIYCPCKYCQNRHLESQETVRQHLMGIGFDKNYTYWDYHGEGRGDPNPISSENEVHRDGGRLDDTHIMLEDMLAVPCEEDNSNNVDNEEMSDIGNLEAIMKLVEDNEKDLYEGCTEFTRLSFLVRLFHIKTISGMANTHFETLLDLLRRVIPKGNESIPKTFYEAKKTISLLGLNYIVIDACPNDCILYHKNYKDLDECPICKVSRWKPKKRTSVIDASKEVLNKKNIAAKVLRYFPLTGRLQRLFMTKDIAKDMRWHSDCRVEDGKLRHPADAEAWKHLDHIYPDFAEDPRSVRLGLASDGFNPFGLMSSAWSTWPVLLFPYNLPPWMCMKQPYMILSLLIPGKFAPGNDIDVYLEPLIDELKLLWDDGVKTYDAYSKKNFIMRAILLWTINDFPAYANLSGYSTKGRTACPVCASDYEGIHLDYSHKFCFWCHRRWLPLTHPFRQQKTKFDGTIEARTTPIHKSGLEIWEDLKNIPNIKFGKDRFKPSNYLKPTKGNKRNRGGERTSNSQKSQELPNGWNKISIFFRLPYWKHLKIRHNLNVMHIEKNVCDNILSTLLQDSKKSKDDLRARRDLVKMEIRKSLQAIDLGNNKFELPSSSINMSKDEMQRFCDVLKNMKLPSGYSSNISSNVQVQERKILNLKTHDCHVLLHQLLPVALRHNLKLDVSKVLIEFCGFFNQLCSRVVDVSVFENLEAQIIETLCKLEVFFPPSFFTIMVHLTVHLAVEARIAGPVSYRWMYPVER